MPSRERKREREKIFFSFVHMLCGFPRTRVRCLFLRMHLGLFKKAVLIFNPTGTTGRYRLDKTTRTAVGLHDNDWSSLQGWLEGRKKRMETIALPFFYWDIEISSRRSRCHFATHCVGLRYGTREFLCLSFFFSPS